MLSPDAFFPSQAFYPFFLEKKCSFAWELLSWIDPFLASWKYRIEGEIDPAATLRSREKISLGRGSFVEAGALLEGPCVIGEGCRIGHGAYIRPGTVLGRGCSVGHAAEVKRSLLFDEAKATHFTYVGDSILGFRVNLGAGAKCANLRLDRKPIAIRLGARRFETGLEKMGAVLGDGVQVGCNAVLNPGTLLYPETKIAPLSSIKGIFTHENTSSAH